MIKANDLRIGNWVSVNIETEEISANMKVAEMINPYQRKIGFINYGYASNRLTASEEEVNPIPLTHEILEKCGFEYLNYYECYFIKTQTGEILLSNEYILQSTDTLTQLKYLHQLQNLFYCLCGKELDITFS